MINLIFAYKLTLFQTVKRSLIVVALLWSGLASSLVAADRPNILLVLSDDQSVPHLGCYGNRDIKTPNLDRLASEGKRFDRAYVSCPQCVPSRATYMTGRSPVGIQMTRFTAPLDAEVVTFPQILRSNGYFTGICGRSFHLDGASQTPFLQSVYREHHLKTFSNRVDYLRVSSQKQALPEMREFLDLAPKEKPFFLWISFNDPHRPLDTNAIPVPHDPAKLTLPAHYPDTQLVREDFARYYDEISRMDGVFGEVMAELEKRGLSSNTIVAFLGDNGASQLRGKGTLYEFGIHVPMIVRWPGHSRAGSESREMISGEDLAPTFLEASETPVPQSMTGHSFLKLLREEPFEGRKQVFAERGAHGSGLPGNSADFDLGRCVVTKTHKLIYNAIPQIPYTPVDFKNSPFWLELQQLHRDGKLSEQFAQLYFSPTRPVFELYDLEKDPSEFENLIGRQEVAALERELKERLAEWMILERDYLPIPVPSEPANKRNWPSGRN